MKPRVYVVVLNWNGNDLIDLIYKCIGSLRAQTYPCELLVVDNGSKDESPDLISEKFPDVEMVRKSKNHGFAGGVNIGIKHAIENKADYVALFNSDAVAEKDWIENLVEALEENPEAGATTCKLLNGDGELIDSTGDFYTTWGLPIARQRDRKAEDAIDRQEEVFGACAGASLYRVSMFKEVGLFDEKFFAYYEDTDLSFRIQLGGWKILYSPRAVALHATGSTSGRIKGFTTLQTTKNLPMLFWKNVPLKLIPHMFPRFFLVYWAIMASSLVKGRGWPAIKGFVLCFISIPHIFSQRFKIQKNKKVTSDYVWSILIHDLPPDARKLRKLRSFFTGRT